MNSQIFSETLGKSPEVIFAVSDHGEKKLNANIHENDQHANGGFKSIEQFLPPNNFEEKTHWSNVIADNVFMYHKTIANTFNRAKEKLEIMCLDLFDSKLFPISTKEATDITEIFTKQIELSRDLGIQFLFSLKRNGSLSTEEFKKHSIYLNNLIDESINSSESEIIEEISFYNASLSFTKACNYGLIGNIQHQANILIGIHSKFSDELMQIIKSKIAVEAWFNALDEDAIEFIPE